MKRIPIYIICGFLSTGKTQFLNKLLIYRITKKPGVVQFEQGITAIRQGIPSLQLHPFEAEQTIRRALDTFVLENNINELWIEWNGMASFHDVEHLITSTTGKIHYDIKQVYFVTTDTYCKTMLGYTGNTILNQLSNADTIIVLNTIDKTTSKIDKSVYQILNNYNNNARLFSFEDIANKPSALFKKKVPSALLFMLYVILFIALLGPVSTYLTDSTYKVFLKLLTIGTGIFFQAVPFLILGNLASAALQVLISPSKLNRWLQGSYMKSIPIALFSGFLFPVCDCSTLPIFRALLKQNVPVPVAMLFMLSSPIINPIVLLSTYYAFINTPILGTYRIVLGLLAALIISFTFITIKKPGSLVKNTAQDLTLTMGQSSNAFLDMKSTMQSSCFTDAKPKKQSKFTLFLSHSQYEFFKMMPYLLFGSFLASASQIWITPQVKTLQLSEHLLLSILFMMTLAFLLSLCSTADAMVARNFVTQFPMPAIMAFLILGPMIDLKNVLLLKALFSKTFVYRLVITIAIVTLFVTYIFILLTGGL